MNQEEKTMARMRGTTRGIQMVAQAMRAEMNPAEMNPAEQRLWEAIKGRQLAGLKFRAQHPVGLFVLDFYCSRYKLAVELDGEIHVRHQAQDEARTQHLASYGYRVLRFRNDEVLDALPRVLATIVAATKQAQEQAPSLPILGEPEKRLLHPQQ